MRMGEKVEMMVLLEVETVESGVVLKAGQMFATRAALTVAQRQEWRGGLRAPRTA